MSLTYLASLDSVRFENPDQPDRLEFASSLKHAEIEMLIALLFGQQIVVSENQSFDSAGFIDIATRVLDKRRNEASRKPFGNPFKVALRRGKERPKKDRIKHLDYRKMIAALMRRENFVLSATPEIDNDKIARKKLAKAIAADSPNFREISHIIGVQKSIKYEKLADYFDNKHSPQIIDTDFADVSLEENIQWLKIQSSDELESIAPQDPQRAIELRDAFSQIEKEGISFSDRSDVRRHGAHLLPPDLYSGVLEYIDKSYNRHVSSSVCAQDRILSDRSSGDYVRIAAELANMKPPNKERYWYSDIPLNITIDPSLSVKFSASIPWDKVWDILTDSDWEKSANKLQQERLVLRDNQFGPVEDAYYSHVKLLTEMLDERLGILEVDQSSRIMKYTKKIIDESVGPILREGVKCYLVYERGIPLPVATAIGIASEKSVTAIKSKVRTWHRRGSMNRAIRSSIQLGGEHAN